MWRVILTQERGGRAVKLVVKLSCETRPEARAECMRLFELGEHFGHVPNYQVVSETGWKQLRKIFEAQHPVRKTNPSTPEQRERWRANHLRRTGVSEDGIRRIKAMGWL